MWRYWGGLIACIDETLQLFSFGRSGQMTDVVIDTCGVILGGQQRMCFQEMKSSWRSLVGGGIGIVRQCFSYHRADPSCANGTASL